MKRFFFPWSLILLVAAACNTYAPGQRDLADLQLVHRVNAPYLEWILDSAHVSGTILIVDPEGDRAISNDFDACSKGHLPASTFKIANSIIALETGVVEYDSTLFKWNGEKRRLPVWEQDLYFRDAFRLSCVPCYQDIARKIGPERMNEYLGKLDYGHMVVDSSCIDVFWLEGESKISLFEQVEFLWRLYTHQLPISEHTFGIMKKLMFIDQEDGYTLSGKTGWSIRNGNNNGWFVGYLETEGKVYYFATNIEPEEDFNMDMFAKIRSEITMKAFSEAGII